MIDLFDPKRSGVPPAGKYEIRLTGHDAVSSPTRGVLRRLLGEIARGPFAGQRVYKPLTEDFRGISWAEDAVANLGLPVPRERLSKQLVACLEALEGAECVATTYNYAHPEGIFPTIGSVRRLDTRGAR